MFARGNAAAAAVVRVRQGNDLLLLHKANDVPLPLAKQVGRSTGQQIDCSATVWEVLPIIQGFVKPPEDLLRGQSDVRLCDIWLVFDHLRHLHADVHLVVASNQLVSI